MGGTIDQEVLIHTVLRIGITYWIHIRIYVTNLKQQLLINAVFSRC